MSTASATQITNAMNPRAQAGTNMASTGANFNYGSNPWQQSTRPFTGLGKVGNLANSASPNLSLDSLIMLSNYFDAPIQKKQAQYPLGTPGPGPRPSHGQNPHNQNPLMPLYPPIPPV